MLTDERIDIIYGSHSGDGGPTAMCEHFARAIEAEVRKEQADKIAELTTQLADARNDSERIDAIEFYTREPDEWESKYGRCKNGDTWCWTFYAPFGVQGDTRAIIDAAIKAKKQP